MNKSNKNPEIGETWIGFNCIKCNKYFPIFHDPSGGKIKFQTDKDKPSKFVSICPFCKTGETYSFEKLEWKLINEDIMELIRQLNNKTN